MAKELETKIDTGSFKSSFVFRMGAKIIERLVSIPNSLSWGIGLLVNLSILVLYTLNFWPADKLATFLILIILYLNFGLLYLRARTNQLRAIEQERNRASQALKEAIAVERNRASQALEKVNQALEKVNQALEKERNLFNQAFEKEKHERVKAFAQRDAKWYLSFSRVLTREDEHVFCTQWGEILGIPIRANHLRYLQHRVSQIEDMCLGRLAGNVQDTILHLLVASTIKDTQLRFLEIGTLFGINAIITYDILSCFFEQVNLTLIDPLDGYYGSDRVDIGTGLPVTRAVLKRNLERLAIPERDYTIVQEYSTTATAVEQVSQKSYNFIFIDGDHSYDGVKADFELYSPLLEPGGYLIFDDYQRENWPEVTSFVDEVVIPSPLYERVGSSCWNTVVFRKKP